MEVALPHKLLVHCYTAYTAYNAYTAHTVACMPGERFKIWHLIKGLRQVYGVRAGYDGIGWGESYFLDCFNY